MYKGQPVAGRRLGVFGWEGSVAGKGNWPEDAGVQHIGKVRSLLKHRYAVSAEYKFND